VDPGESFLPESQKIEMKAKERTTPFFGKAKVKEIHN